ncbi:MAG: hypothetical protein JXA21_07455 [Anaerolineae bacterium]|nr:hypothetical protein [Anaerolineae bacterium]
MYKTAQAQYKQASTLEDLPAILTALESVWELMQNIACQSPDTPQDLPEGYVDLQQRVAIAIESIETFPPSDGLLKIREFIRMRDSDPTLKAIHTQLEGRAREQIDSTKIAAQAAINSGDLTEAEEKLRLVRELDPTDMEAVKLYAEIRQRRTLAEKLRTVEREAEAKLAGSPVDAMKTWRQGVNILLEPDGVLPEQVYEILNELITLGDRDNGLSLAQPDNWQTTQDRLEVLGNLRRESWVVGRAQFFVDQWIRLARDNALRGVVASAAQLGNLIEAYRAAATYLKLHPTEVAAIQQFAERAEALIHRVNEATNKRVQRAESALNAGEYQAALHNLQDVEEDFYHQIDQEFPGLLEGQDEVRRVRNTIAELQEKAQELQSLDEKARPEIEKARQAYLDNEWDAAEKTLEMLPALKELPDLDAAVRKLREQIANARVEATRKTLYQVMSQIETGRHLATTVEELSDYLDRLEKLQKEINLRALDVDERNFYFQVLSDVRQQREDWAAGAVWEEQIEIRRQKKDYFGALKAVEKRLETLREGSKRPYLEMLRNEMEKLVTEQQERDATLKAGQVALDAQQYTEACRLFEKAVRLGTADARDLLRAARAGAALQSAQRWDVEQDADKALMDLNELAQHVENNPYAEHIAEEASYLRQRIERSQQGTFEMQYALAEARQWLVNGQFTEAQESVQKILERDPAAKEALALQMQIRERRILQEMLEKARTAQQTGRYKEALQLVETVLEKQPDDPEARLLKRQMEAVINADKTFLQVETLAKQMRFKEARELLTELSRQDADPDKLRQVQQLMDALEKEQWTRVVHPIQELYREGEYAEAWNRCKQASGRTAAPELLDELQTLQALIINSWAEKQAQAARGQLQKRLEQEQLRDLEAQLKSFLILDPSPEEHWVRQFEDLLRETRTRRLRLRLEQARERFEDWRKEGMRSVPQAALDIIESVQKEAEDLGVQVEFDITLDAASLAAEIHEAYWQSISDRLEQEYNQKMSYARALQSQLEDVEYIAQKSPGRIDLERLEEAVEEIFRLKGYESRTAENLTPGTELAKVKEGFRVKGYENDGPARELATWVRNALDTFERTQNAMKRARDLAGNKRFRDAEIELRGAGVSPLLKAAFERQRDIISALARAEIHQNNEAWDLALQEYRRVVALDANFEPAPDKDMERCYQRLRERVVAEVTDFLNQTPPDTVAARAKLTQAETAGWITPLVSRDYDRLRNWLASQEYVAQAAALLQAHDGDLREAKKALDEAKRLLPGDQPDTAIHQWESLLEALDAWEAYQQRPSLLPRTLAIFKALQPPISGLRRAQILCQTLEEEVERRRIRQVEEEAAEKRRLLEELAQKIGDTLGTPKDYAGALQALEHASPKITTEAAFTAQCHRVRDDIRITIEGAIKELNYAQALEVADILKRLPLLDAETRMWAIGLPGVQTDAFNEQLQMAETALQRLDEQGVHSALADAARIIAPESDRLGRIADLQGKLLLIQIERIEKEIRDAYQKRIFDLVALWQQIDAKLAGLPVERRSSTEFRVNVLRDHISEVEKMWHKYLEAQEQLQKGRQDEDVTKLKEANKRLDEVIQCPLHDETIDSIRGDAEKLQRQIWFGVWGKADLKMVKQRLFASLLENPREQALWPMVKLVLASEYLEGFVVQSTVVQKQMEKIQQKRQQDLDQYNQMTRREAKGWYWASLCFAVISVGVFIYAIFILLQSREALDYLTPLYTLLPGLLSALFFNQYNQANQRIDVERERIALQTENVSKQLSSEAGTTHAQLLQELQNLQFATATMTDLAPLLNEPIQSESIVEKEGPHVHP